MPSFPERLLKSVVNISSSSKGSDGGTGFLVGRKVEEGQYELFVVTNSHVLGSLYAAEVFIQLNTKDGKSESISTSVQEWRRRSGLDLAIYRIALDPEKHDVGFVRYPEEDIVDPDFFERFSFGPGEQVIMVGRFLGLPITDRVQPILRYGNLSSLPIETQNPAIGLKQKSFLVDMHSRKGFSGSPVFIEYFDRIEKRGGQSSGLWSGTRLIGVNWGSKTDKFYVRGNDEFKDTYVEIPSSMNYVLPIWELASLLA